MPRKAKPPADPVALDRTEGDLDAIITAVEQHMKESDRLGKALNGKTMTTRQVLEAAAQADEKLYNLVDTIVVERTGEVEEMIEEGKI